MHTIPRLDLRALTLALGTAALADIALYVVARAASWQPLGAGMLGMVGAGLLAAGIYLQQSKVAWRPSLLQAPASKKKRSRQGLATSTQDAGLDPTWGLRAVTLLVCAWALQWGAQDLGLVRDPLDVAWRTEMVTFGGGLVASWGLLAWGARFWLQTTSDPTPVPLGVGTRLLRDYLPVVLGFVGTALMLWIRAPTLFCGEMSSDLAQGAFWQAYEGASWHFDGQGVAWLPASVAYLCQTLHLSARAVPYVYQGVACAVLAASVTAFAWPAFRPLLASDLARFLICMGLACQPDYALKTLAHVGGYAAIVVLLVVWLVLCADGLRWSRAAGAGLAVSVLALSHPSCVAFLPGLLFFLGVALYRKQLPGAAFCALASFGPCIQMWAQALPHRAASVALGADAADTGMLIAKFTGMLPAWGIGGKALLSLHAGDEAAYVLWLCAAAAAIACLLQVNLTPQGRPWRTMLAVAMLTVATGVGCHVLMAPEAASALWEGGHLASLAAPAWFVPCVGVFLALAVGIGRSRLNQQVPWALCLWLFAGYPFGLGQLPRAQFWPAHGFSAWQALAPQVLGQSPPRGCIPVNPFPAYLGMDCQLLHSVGSATGLGGWMTFFNEVPLPTPAPAEAWSVDSIGIAFNKTPPLDVGPWEIPIIMVALGNDGNEILRTKATFHPPEIFTYFTFTTPLEHVAKVKLILTPGSSLAMGIESQETREPFWVWFGRGQPEEGGEGVHLAEH